MNSEEPNEASRQLTTWLVRLSTLAVCAFVVLSSLGFYLYESANVRDELLREEAARVDLQARLFHKELQSVVNHLLVLADGDAIRSYLASGALPDLDRAARRAAFVSLQQSNFDQIRLLDERGWEIMRVNRGGEIVPRTELQDKSQRPYFHKAETLQKGQIYVSRFDLNVENGQVEVPFRPVIRFALPLFGQDGERRGVYVINYLGSDLQKHLKQIRPEVAHRMRLLDSYGCWLQAARPEQEWSFMFPEREGLALASTDTGLWSRIVKNKSGHELFGHGGVLSWQWIKAPLINGGRIDSVVADENFLVIASEVSGAEQNAQLAELRLVFLMLTSTILVVVAIGGGLFHHRRRVSEALHQSQERLAITLHSIGDAVLATDTQGRVTWMNPIAEQLTGWTEIEAVGQSVENVFCIVNEATRQPTEIPISRALATGEIQTLANHTILIARDGREIPIADSAAPIRGKDRTLVGSVLTFRDLTAERNAQMEREQFFNRSRDLLGIASTDGYFKRVNPSFSRTLGWDEDEILSQPYLDIVHPDDRAATLNEVATLASGQPTLHFENRFLCKDGSWCWLAWAVTPQPDGLLYASARDVTELKQAEDSLRESEESLAITLNSIGDGVLATDRDGRVTRLNRVAEELTGWPETEARGQPVEDVFKTINEKTREPTKIPVAKVVLTGQIPELANHTALIARDGTERAIADSAAPIWNSRGQIAGVVLVFRDVTDERREQERFRTVVEAAPNAMVMIDDRRRITLVNSQAKQLFGYTRNEMLGEQIEVLLSQRFRQQHAEHVDSFFAAPHSRTMSAGRELFGLQKDGTEVPIELYLSPVATAEGKFVLVSVMDITEQKEAEEALRASEQEFRSLAESMPQIVWVAQADGRYIYFNQHWTVYTGMTLEESYGDNWSVPFHPDDQQRASDAWQRATSTVDTYDLECRLRRVDGVYRWWLIRGAPQVDDDGLVLNWFGTCTDIEDIKRAEEEARRLNNQLEDANKELESFSYSVSHDLRAPLRHIQGYVEMLAKDLGDQLSEKSQRYLTTVSDCALEMGQLIDDLLEFSRMGRSELRDQSVSLDSLTEQLIDSLKASTEDREIIWKVSPLPDVVGDRAMLNLAFANLLSNAVKYTRPRNPAEIEIGCLGRQDEHVVLFVRDNGVGFDMKYVQKLFGVFQRLHGANEFEGTGIGLANVRRIIARHGGKTWAESKLNEGATFFVTLKPVSAK